MPKDSHGSLALLVEDIPQAPLNAEFHSAAVRSANAFWQLPLYPQQCSEIQISNVTGSLLLCVCERVCVFRLLP